MSEKIIRTVAEALGDGVRTPDFEQFLVDWHHLLKTYGSVTDPDVLRLLRFMHIFSVAAVEGGRQASAALGDTPESTVKIVNAMVQGASIAVGCAICSVLDDDTPAAVLRQIMEPAFAAGLDEVIRSQRLK